MSTITKEFTKEQLQQIEAAAKEVMWPVVWSEKKAREHFSEKITPKVVLELARIALASLEAEPAITVGDDGGDALAYRRLIQTFAPGTKLYTAPPAPTNVEPLAWLWSHRKHSSEVTLVRPEDDERAEGAHWSGWSCQALYAEPHVAVSVPDYPETLPCPVMLEPGLRFGKGVNTRIMLDALQRRAEYHAELEAMTPEQRAEHDAGMKEFAAMLQGAEHVTAAYKLPANTPCKDAPEHIWLQTAGVWPENGEFSELTWCSDNQHPDDTLYVRADVVPGNFTVTPGGWKLVPNDPTTKQWAAGMQAFESGMDKVTRVYKAMLAAAPQLEVK